MKKLGFYSPALLNSYNLIINSPPTLVHANGGDGEFKSLLLGSSIRFKSPINSITMIDYVCLLESTQFKSTNMFSTLQVGS